MTPTPDDYGGIRLLDLPGGEFARAEVTACVNDDVCRGSRWILEEDDGGYETAVPCPCSPMYRRVDCYNDARLPREYGRKTVPGYVDQGSGNQGRIKTLLNRYLREFDMDESHGIVLVGEPGVGKTHLMCGLVHYLTLELGVRCRFVDFFQLTARIRASFDSKNNESEQSILRPLVDVPILAIDELGKGLGTLWEQNVIDQLISRRYNAGGMVIATSNYLPEAWMPQSAGRDDASRLRLRETLEERIGDRIFSRLWERCDFHQVEGPNFRPLIDD